MWLTTYERHNLRLCVCGDESRNEDLCVLMWVCWLPPSLFFRVVWRAENRTYVPLKLMPPLIGVKKSRAERMAKKLSTCVANQRRPFFHSTWAYDFILEKREKKGHIFVRDQWITSTLKSSGQPIDFRVRYYVRWTSDLINHQIYMMIYHFS